MVGHGGSGSGSYLADPTPTIPSHCASIVVTSTLRVKVGNTDRHTLLQFQCKQRLLNNYLLTSESSTTRVQQSVLKDIKTLMYVC